jgi:hypothetical protein
LTTTISRSAIIESLKAGIAHSKPGRVGIAYNYCHHANSGDSNISNLFGCLLAQLAQQSKVIRNAALSYLETFGRSHAAGRTTDYKELTKIMIKEQSDLDLTFLVIDALDEFLPLTPGREQNHEDSKHLDLVLSVLTEMAESDCKIKILVTSRSYDSIKYGLGTHQEIAVTSDRNSVDIGLFLRAKVDKHFKRMSATQREKKPGTGYETLKDELVKTLLEKADGMLVSTR